MAYTKRIVCLAKSFKHGGICIAGRELTPQGIAGWIRPVSKLPTGELTYLNYRYADGTSPKLLDVVDIPFLSPVPHHHQTENHLIDTSQLWKRQREISYRQLKNLVEDPPSLWCNADHTSHGKFDCVRSQQAFRYRSSLYLLEKTDFVLEIGRQTKTKRTYRGLFEHHGIAHNLSVTDPIARDHFETAKPGRIQFRDYAKVYLCVSLTEPYQWDRRCHKLIAAIITDPLL